LGSGRGRALLRPECPGPGRAGDVYTLTGRYQGQTVVKHVIARPDTTGKQQVDVWMDGRRAWVPFMRMVPVKYTY